MMMVVCVWLCVDIREEGSHDLPVCMLYATCMRGVLSYA